MGKIKLALIGLVGSFAFAAPTLAAELVGQNVTYCTNSVYFGAVSLDPSQCNNVNVSTFGTKTISTSEVEIILGSNRFVDLTNGLITITYNSTGSASPDLFVLTGLSGIGGLSLISDNLGLETTFSSTAIGLLVSGNPGGPGVARFAVASADAVPEPTTWLMMLLGFGLIGGAMRVAKRSQKNVRLA
ncbi:PEPxxWA-CTERM sorting domain-containing protein [Novosphingobium piscinae]|nr:PEPxxWA-CTERM sorting domain-containing protein [Novosphingobium piscinae]